MIYWEYEEFDKTAVNLKFNWTEEMGNWKGIANQLSAQELGWA